MAGLKSLGLAGARKALRRLFRRPAPADDSDDTSTSPVDTAKRDTESGKPINSTTSTTNSITNEDSITNTNINTNGAAAVDSMAVDGSRHGSKRAGAAATVAAERFDAEDKENKPPSNQVDAINSSLAGLKLDPRREDGTEAKSKSQELEQEVPAFDDPAVLAERAVHLQFIGEALEMARLALRTNETPVGCVLVRNGEIIAKGMNATNVTRNGTRHAELMAISALLSYPPRDGTRTTCLKPKQILTVERNTSDTASDAPSTEPEQQRSPDEGNEDGSKSHLYPYGQKLYPVERVHSSIIRETILYVTVEPCVMCASLLRQLGIKKVYFGAVNDKFGGTGGVFSIHANSLPVSADGQTASSHPIPNPIQYPDGGGSLGTSFPPGGGDGGDVEPGYEIEGGWGRDEAVALLRRFYVQENGRAPVPRKKEGRAARLAAMIETDGLDETATAADGQEEEMELAGACATPRKSHRGNPSGIMDFDVTGKENVDPLDGADAENHPGSYNRAERDAIAQ